MLRGIQVLAVSGDSVISNPDEEEGGSKKRTNSRGTLVTLMVDPKQAEALQLAVENGSISLSLRNPLDRNEFELEGTVLSQGRLAHFGSMLTPTVSPAVPNEQRLSEQPLSNDNPQDPTQAYNIFGTNVPVQQPKSEGKNQTREYPRWGITVIRGQQTKVEELDVSGNEADGTTAKK
jgi:hypothetical protein